MSNSFKTFYNRLLENLNNLKILSGQVDDELVQANVNLNAMQEACGESQGSSDISESSDTSESTSSSESSEGIPDNVPSLLSPKNNESIQVDAAHITMINLSWASQSFSDKYDLRMNDLTDPSLRLPGNNCGVDKHYLCKNKLFIRNYATTVRVGHKYKWWVHIHGEPEAAVGYFEVEGAPETELKIIYPTHGSVVPIATPRETTVTSWGGKKIPTSKIDASSDDYLIKPVSEHGGIVILMPWFYWSAIQSAVITRGTEQLVLNDTSRDYPIGNSGSFPNGARVHFRHGTNGNSIRQATLTVTLKNGKKASYSTNFAVRNTNWSLNFDGVIPDPDPDPNADGIITVRWEGPNDKAFDILADDLTNSSLRINGNTCTGHYMCRKSYGGKTFALDVNTGHRYRFRAQIAGESAFDEVVFNTGGGGGGPPPTGKMRAAMLTDKACDKRNNVVTQTARDLANGTRYNTVSILVDLQMQGRNYVDWGRKDNKLTALALRNIDTLRNAGNRIVLMTRNDWSLKNRYYTDGNLGQWSSVYNNTFLNREKEFLTHVKSVVNPDGIQLCLEADRTESVDFYLHCLRHLRNIGYSKNVYVNFVGGSAQNRLSQLKNQYIDLKGEAANSCHDLNNFCQWHVINTDGANISQGAYPSTYNRIAADGRPFIVWTSWFVKGNIPSGVF